ncbi:MAG TPA: type II toxin-antitoxin system prevent-host-death family antitoxin [Fimbriimonas sp.]|nr:type II toxin-antitoxin system prevent-host-death family antitoxin [Fimbriimonas sp.]
MLNQRELRNDSGEVMRALENGEAFTVSRNGVPVGELTPVQRNRFIDTRQLQAKLADAPKVDYKRFRADLDALLHQDPTPRG